MAKTRSGSRYQPYSTSRPIALAHHSHSASRLSQHHEVPPTLSSSLTATTDISGVLSHRDAPQRCIYQVRSDTPTSLPPPACPVVRTSNVHTSHHTTQAISSQSAESSSQSSIDYNALSSSPFGYGSTSSAPTSSTTSSSTTSSSSQQVRRSRRVKRRVSESMVDAATSPDMEPTRQEPPSVHETPMEVASSGSNAGIGSDSHLSTDLQSDNTTNDLSTLSPYQRVTRNLYRQGAVNDPDIGMDVFDTYAKIRMGTMNMTVSMQREQVVVFRFDSNPGLNHWPSKSDPLQNPTDTSHFPELLPLPPRVEARLKYLSSAPKPVYEVDELSRIFNELQDDSDSHPVALIMMSILEALDKVPPTGHLHDIATVLESLESAERLIPGFELHEPSSFYEFDDTIDEEEDARIEKCSICLSQLAHSFPLAQLKRCKHMFHSECLTSWHKVKFTCPLCRSHLSPMRVKIVYKRHSA